MEKVWQDSDDKDEERPDSITVSLMNGNVEVDTQELSDSNEWSFIFTDLPKYDDNNRAITYTVAEISEIDGYNTEINGNTITNIRTTSISVQKEWKDGNNADNSRPRTIDVKLMNGETQIQTQTLSETNNWSYTFADLPKYDANGAQIDYSVLEANTVRGYVPEVTGTADDGFVLTNTRVIDITVNKTWVDANNKDGKRPESITAKLMNGSTEVATATISATNNWSYTFTNLPKYDLVSEEEIAYTVQEINAPAGYSSEVNGYTITNTELTEITVNKVWVDGNNADNLRPESINAKLMNGSTEVATATIKATDNWTYTFTNLPKYNTNGSEIRYTVIEASTIEGYKGNVEGNTITNTRVIDIPVTKHWNDFDNKFNTRTSIQVNLLDGTEIKDTATIQESNNWTHTFTNKPKYNENGQLINYTINEINVEEYTTQEIAGNSTTGFEITNNFNNVTLNKQTLVKKEIDEQEETVNVDVVFVLDVSGSMTERMSKTDKTVRAKAMVDAANKAITEIMKNPLNRIAVVMYQEDVQITLELDHYSAKPKTSSIPANTFLRYSNSTITTNVNELNRQVSKYVTGGTYTQLGLAVGAQILSQETDTTDRTPVLILLTDGDSTLGSTDYANISSSTEADIGTGSSTSGELGYLTVLTANKYKNDINDNYKTVQRPHVAQMYTIGLGLSGDFSTAVLNPTEENVSKLQTSSSNNAKTLYDYLTGAKTTVNKNGTWSWGTYIEGEEVSVPNVYADNYNYADGSWVKEMSASDLDSILTDITENITKYYETTTTKTTNLGVGTVRVELENLDINEKVFIKLDGSYYNEEGTSVADLMTQNVIIKEGTKYYMDLKASIFTNKQLIDITYYEVSNL